MNPARGTIRDQVAHLQGQEQPLLDLYRSLAQALTSATARQLAERMLRAQRFQLSTLELLAEDRLPERFECFGSVTHPDVNARRGPSAREAKTGTLQQGLPVIVQEYRGNWAHLQLPDGSPAWVFRDYVRCDA